tara:strand:- start:67 stop:627 length:561 start_codon:yes stop_codon:yes gene_type:complete
MRITLILSTILFCFTSFSQDKELFEYINIYRETNGLKKLKWNNELLKISIKQNNDIRIYDSLFHSHKDTYENILKSNAVPNTLKMEIDFKVFCKKYFNYDYRFNSNIDNDKLNSISKMYIVFLWDNSELHKNNMLREDVKIGSCDSFVGNDYVVFNNTITIGGLSRSFSNLPSHYKVEIYSTLNMR